MKLKILAALTVAAAIGVVACSKHPSSTALGRVVVHLTDAPGDFEEVNLVVTGVSIHRGDEDDGGWETLKDETVTYDLMKLRNGVFTTLAVADVPAGHYTQIRLHIGEGSHVVVDETTHPLEIPSGMQSGYKLVGEFDVPAEGTLELTLDFDAARSIVRTGNGRYKLKPTVRVIVNEAAGAITGRVLPEGVPVSVSAMVGEETLQTTEVGSDGSFTLAALPAGTYSVAIRPAHDYQDVTLSGVEVTAGATTDLGVIELTPQ